MTTFKYMLCLRRQKKNLNTYTHTFRFRKLFNNFKTFVINLIINYKLTYLQLQQYKNILTDTNEIEFWKFRYNHSAFGIQFRHTDAIFNIQWFFLCIHSDTCISFFKSYKLKRKKKRDKKILRILILKKEKL